MSDYNDVYDSSLGRIVTDGTCQNCGQTIRVLKRGPMSDYEDGAEVEPKHTCNPDDVRRYTGY